MGTGWPAPAPGDTRRAREHREGNGSRGAARRRLCDRRGPARRQGEDRLRPPVSPRTPPPRSW